MSDNESVGSSPSRSSGSDINNPRRLPLDFPIRTRTLTTEGSLHNQMARIMQEFQQLQWHIAQREVGIHRDASPNRQDISLNIRVNSIPLQASSIPAQQMQGASSTGTSVAMGPTMHTTQRKVLKKPITTLINTLPRTQYADQEDSAEKTLEYVTVQRAVLDYLGKRASDTLSPRQACAWTQAIEPMTKEPTPKDALRLCYYMRSQGFDTYAEVKDTVVSLFVADQEGKDDADARGRDMPYWKQDIPTHEVLYSVSSATRNGSGRRNAIVSHSPPIREAHHDVEIETMISGLRGSGPWGSILDSMDGVGYDDEFGINGMDQAGGFDVLSLLA
ncbi:hypothetical protein J1614_005481 [Plenodomus biglobosus]|nr:hypothetical protein J1614_005481 [Plenodomus biglobosus]